MNRVEAPKTSKMKRLVVRISMLALVAACLTGTSTSAHTIDYLAAAISPAASFNGNSGNFTLNNSVVGGASITFNLTFEIDTQGSTTSYPRTVTFGVDGITKPLGASDPAVTFGEVNPTATANHTFVNPASTFSTLVTIAAPSQDGAYSVKIAPTAGTGGPGGLAPGGGINVHFTVANPPDDPTCNNAATALSVALSNTCIVFGAPSVDVTATLTSGGSPLSGKTVELTIGSGSGDPASIGSGVTDLDGKVMLSYNPSQLSVGDHSVGASFQGDGCDYQSSSNSATLGVQYMFQGFQQPINADGTSQFGGRTIPVKIKVLDYYGVSVPNADARVFFAFGTPQLVGTEAEPVANTNGDSGNLMRYDFAAQQYIFNWDIAGLANGTYTIRVGLGEGECAAAHTVLVTLKKKGSK